MNTYTHSMSLILIKFHFLSPSDFAFSTRSLSKPSVLLISCFDENYFPKFYTLSILSNYKSSEYYCIYTKPFLISSPPKQTDSKRASILTYFLRGSFITTNATCYSPIIKNLVPYGTVLY